MPVTIPGNTPRAVSASLAQRLFEPWALDRATSIIAAAHGRPYLAAVRDIAELLELTRSEGMRDGFRQANEIVHAHLKERK